MMTSRERLLTVLDNGTPDHLPCQVHSWMQYYLDTYLDGRDQYGAYEYFPGMDWVIYQNPDLVYSEHDLANWRTTRREVGPNQWQEVIETPEGTLTHTRASNVFTTWSTEHIIKTERDFALWEKYVPVPISVDWTPVADAQRRIGEKGIVRGSFFGFGQGSPWQDFCTMYGTEPSIMATFDEPDWVHHVLETLLEKKLAVIERAGRFEMDLVETGGGAGSSTVISPRIHREFCLPYDQRQIEALHAGGTKVVYHLCGGLMPLLELVAENGADGLETMTPPLMGADVDLVEANRRVGNRLFFIGGFDQNQGFEQGTPEIAARLLRECHEA
ncbi:MAG: hypothetical protein MUQ10_20335, partial [Anaerolineae bacterium]|nr:hypothetical protein [Anaerolineae bacterium]